MTINQIDKLILKTNILKEALVFANRYQKNDSADVEANYQELSEKLDVLLKINDR